MAKILMLTFSILIILLFSINFNAEWSDKNYERLKNKNAAWYWFRVFKINETKENFNTFYRGLSVFVISIMSLTIILIFCRG